MGRTHRFLPCRRWAAALLLAGAYGTQAQIAPAVGPESTDGHRPTPVLHPNPQSIFDGLRYAYVNVGSGNLTFQRRDIVAGRTVPIIFARLHDSRIAENADFGPGWRLSLAEEVVFNGNGATYVDSAGADRRFRAGPDGFLPHPPAPDWFGWTLEAFDDTALVRAPDGTERLFERHEGSARFLLRRVAGSGGATQLSYRTGLLDRVAGSDGEVIKVSRRADGRVASVSDGHGRSVEYRYDEAGRLLDVRDVAGHIWWHEYDAVNRLTAALDPNGEVLLRASYDQRGRVASLDDGRRHIFEYAPRRTVVEGEDGGRRVFEQDRAGATLAHAAPGGVAWRIGFDHRHRVKSLAYSEAALAPPARARAKALRKGTAVRPTWAGTVTFQHDDQDRLIAEDHRPIIGTANTPTTPSGGWQRLPRREVSSPTATNRPVRLSWRRPRRRPLSSTTSGRPVESPRRDTVATCSRSSGTAGAKWPRFAPVATPRYSLATPKGAFWQHNAAGFRTSATTATRWVSWREWNTPVPRRCAWGVARPAIQKRWSGLSLAASCDDGLRPQAPCAALTRPAKAPPRTRERRPRARCTTKPCRWCSAFLPHGRSRTTERSFSMRTFLCLSR